MEIDDKVKEIIGTVKEIIEKVKGNIKKIKDSNSRCQKTLFFAINSKSLQENVSENVIICNRRYIWYT